MENIQLLSTASYTPFDYQMMAKAVRLAKNGMYTAHPNPRVGCVITNQGSIVGEGWHEVAGEPHAEINALAVADNKAKDATVYVTLEPCCHHGKTPPCSDALIAAGVKRVVVAMQDPHKKVAGKGISQLQEAGIEVSTGLLEVEARALNPGFIKRMETGRPFVRSKLAMSLDGRTAMASGESKWITSSSSRDDVQRLRAQSSAILTGVGTILADDPAMTVRLAGTKKQPLRVVLDTHLSMPDSANILRQQGQTLVMTCRDDVAAKERLENAGAEVINMPLCSSNVDMESVLDRLGQLEVNEVLLETGATLSGSMLSSGLIDEMVIYMAPVLMGDKARGLFNLPLLNSMAEKIPLKINDIRAVGADWRITVSVDKSAQS